MDALVALFDGCGASGHGHDDRLRGSHRLGQTGVRDHLADHREVGAQRDGTIAQGVETAGIFVSHLAISGIGRPLRSWIEEGVLMYARIMLEAVNQAGADGDGASVFAVEELLEVFGSSCPWAGGIGERRLDRWEGHGCQRVRAVVDLKSAMHSNQR